MTRTVMILSLIAVLATPSQAFASGTVGFPIGPGGSPESTSAGSTVRIDLPVAPDCASRPEAILVDEAARGLCK